MATIQTTEYQFGHYGGTGRSTRYELPSVGTLIHSFTHDVATGRTLELISVQVFDAYRYQREWNIGQTRVSGTHTIEWHSHAYQHPGRHSHAILTHGVARRLMDRVLHLTREYPSLLWNPADDRRPKMEGFVLFHDALLWGAAPSVELLP